MAKTRWTRIVEPRVKETFRGSLRTNIDVRLTAIDESRGVTLEMDETDLMDLSRSLGKLLILRAEMHEAQARHMREVAGGEWFRRKRTTHMQLPEAARQQRHRRCRHDWRLSNLGRPRVRLRALGEELRR